MIPENTLKEIRSIATSAVAVINNGFKYELKVEHLSTVLTPPVVISLLDELETLRADNKRYEEALDKISAYDDAYANSRLRDTGSYASFDNPEAVKIARAARTPKPESGNG